MKKLITLFAFVVVCAFSAAQGLGFKYNGRDISVTYPFRVASFESLFNWKVKTEILGYAGSRIEDGKIMGGGAWVTSFPIAKPGPAGGIAIFGYAGLGADFVDGVPRRVGVVFGVRF